MKNNTNRKLHLLESDDSCVRCPDRRNAGSTMFVISPVTSVEMLFKGKTCSINFLKQVQITNN